MQRRRKINIQRQFKTQLKPTISYDPIVDKHLQYYFANKQNRRILRKNKIINRGNHIIDKSINKKIYLGQLTIQNNFKPSNKTLKKVKPQRYTNSKQSYRSQFTNKEKFNKYLSQQKRKIQISIEKIKNSHQQ